jgi:cytochrome b translational activator protein CBS2, mitochondrial
VASSSDHSRKSTASPLPDQAPTHNNWPWSGAEPATKRARPAPQFTVPSVLLPAEASKAPTVHKIHILGDDERSRFIAHALSGVYDSVELLGWTRQPTSKYRNVARKTHRGGYRLERNAAQRRPDAKMDKTHIDELIVTGAATEAVQALESVKDRVDKDTTVCIVSDGLGVLEDVRKRIFSGTDLGPDFVLGHMSHKLAFNRNTDAVKTLKLGQMLMTRMQTTRADLHVKTEARSHLVESMTGMTDLRSSFTTYDQWLRFKLPSIIFSTVVEPVCVLLDVPYQGLLQNPAAQRMMARVTDELVATLRALPEAAESSAIQDFLRGNGIRRLVYNGIMAKRDQPSHLARLVDKGLPTDLHYLNGYFIRRGKQLGLDLRTNTMLMDMVLARHSKQMERLNSFIPIEETSVPSELGFRYRKSPNGVWHGANV